MSALADVAAEGELIEATDREGVIVGPDLILLPLRLRSSGRVARRSSLWRRSGVCGECLITRDHVQQDGLLVLRLEGLTRRLIGAGRVREVGALVVSRQRRPAGL